jgi:hypothetical protein|tara:strand:- start:3472 stop:4146 length:675 start_codon:yes stop_codon:yes gene_type:complete
MKLSKDTLDTLKNFATINTNILVREGSTLSTISTGKNIFARSEITESFPREFAIYDLNGLLPLLTLMEDTDVDFGDESLKVTKGTSVFEYFYADPNIIVSAPDKSIEVDNFFQFDLSKDDIDMIMKAAAITAAPMLSIVGDGAEVVMKVGDPSTPKSNSFQQVIGTTDKQFDARLAVENFKVIPGSYSVILSEKKFMFLQSTKGETKYWLALERSSVVGVPTNG